MPSVITSNIGSGLALQPDASGQLQFSTGYGGTQLALANNVLTMGSNVAMTMGDGTQWYTAQSLGTRNRIINGAMQIDQRSNGASFTMTASTYGSYGSCDRWNFGNSNASGCVAQRVTSTLAGFPYALQIQRSSTSTVTGFFGTAQDIETLNCQDLAGQTVTLSFYAQAGANFSAASNLINVFVATGTGTDQSSNLMWTSAWTGFAKPLNTTATLTTTWTRYSYTVVIPAGTNEIAAAFYYTPTGTAGTADYFQITGVQLEPGPVATPFERKLYNQVLADCQRYYEKSYDTTVNPGTVTSTNAFSLIASSSLVRYPAFFKVTKRIVNGTITFYSTAGSSGFIRNNSASSDLAVSTVTGSVNGYASSNGGTTNNEYIGQWTVDAEL